MSIGTPFSCEGHEHIQMWGRMSKVLEPLESLSIFAVNTIQMFGVRMLKVYERLEIYWRSLD